VKFSVHTLRDPPPHTLQHLLQHTLQHTARTRRLPQIKISVTHCTTYRNAHRNIHCNSHCNTLREQGVLLRLSLVSIHCNTHCITLYTTHCNTDCNTLRSAACCNQVHPNTSLVRISHFKVSPRGGWLVQTPARGVEAQWYSRCYSTLEHFRSGGSKVRLY